MIKEQQFWDWFKKNEAKYFFLNQINDDDEKESLLDGFLKQLHLYCDKLFFEIGGHPDETQDLIITAGGNTDFFNKVESLVEQAPVFENWNIIAFKPAVASGSIIEYNGVNLDSEKIYFDPLENKASTQIGLRLFVDNYDPTQKDNFLNAACLLLDSILGERLNALDIGYVEVKDINSVPDINEFIELNRLPKYIKWKKAKNDN